MNGKTTDTRSACLALNRQPWPTPIRYVKAGAYAFAYLLFALGCCAVALSIPWLRWREKDSRVRTQRLRAQAGGLCRWFLNYSTGLGLLTVDFHNLTATPRGLIVANHPSLVDALWILAMHPQVCCVLKADLEKSRLFRYVVESLNYVSNQNPEHLLEEGCRRLTAGETLLVFPEATRTPPDTPPIFRLGAAELIVRSGVTVHPVVIYKTGTYLSKSRPWYHFPKRPFHWDFDFADPINYSGSTSPRTERRRVNDELQSFFQDQLASAKLAHEPNRAEN